MAQYPITHTCGHSAVAQIVGTNSHNERERKASWMAQQPCRDCRNESTRIEAAAETADLPALTGSDKQVAWATTLRADGLRKIDAELARIAELSGETIPQAAIDMVAAVKAKTDASWWIDHRDESARMLIQAAQK